MSTQMNVFLTEGNVEIYLSKLHLTWKPEERDKLLRLLAREEQQMGAASTLTVRKGTFSTAVNASPCSARSSPA
jgi:hypothetical protein